MLGLALAAGIMVEPLFNNFATVAFFEFIVFAIFEMRFLLTVWRARRSNNADLWQVTVGPHESVCTIFLLRAASVVGARTMLTLCSTDCRRFSGKCQLCMRGSTARCCAACSWLHGSIGKQSLVEAPGSRPRTFLKASLPSHTNTYKTVGFRTHEHRL